MARQDVQRYEAYNDIIAIQRVISALLIVIVIIMSVTQLGWFVGVVVSVIIVLWYPVIARLPLIIRYGQKLYDVLEPRLLQFITRFPRFIAIFRARPADIEPPIITSKEELQHSVALMTSGISVAEKRLVTHGLLFGARLVSEVMTPKSMVDTVEAKELLGPLALDGLHKTGHSRFPVIESDIDHIVGILHIQDLLVATAKKTPTASQAMEPKVFYIREDQTLQYALNAFIRTRHHLFIVVNEYRETVGVVSLEDVMEALLGQEIIDEFDAHDDLRKVAAHNPRKNNEPSAHTNV